jgi:hypothetical protein
MDNRVTLETGVGHWLTSHVRVAPREATWASQTSIAHLVAPPFPSTPSGVVAGQSPRSSRRRRAFLSHMRGSPAAAARRPGWRAAGGGAGRRGGGPGSLRQGVRSCWLLGQHQAGARCATFCAADLVVGCRADGSKRWRRCPVRWAVSVAGTVDLVPTVPDLARSFGVAGGWPGIQIPADLLMRCVAIWASFLDPWPMDVRAEGQAA